MKHKKFKVSKRPFLKPTKKQLKWLIDRGYVWEQIPQRDFCSVLVGTIGYW
jgi:hypothetical protein